jgi:CTP synthase
VKELLTSGIQPDILICRTEHPLTTEIRDKLALFCNVEKESVIEAIDAETIYDVPLLMLKEKLDRIVLKKSGIKEFREADLTVWKEFLGKLKNPLHDLRIGLIGKYNELPDAYKSIYEAIYHAGAINECDVKVIPIHSEVIEDPDFDGKEIIDLDGIIVAPGFGDRGIDGKLKAIEVVRKKKIPFFGICLGMQCAVVEFARNILKLQDAQSTEWSGETQHPVIDIMPEQKNIKKKGGTMRLGSYDCKLSPRSKASRIYGERIINERHRHRYEFNNAYLDKFEQKGFKATGINPDTNLVEIVELRGHPWFVGVQFHPEYKSRVERPHPLFLSFTEACLEQQEKEK